LAAALLIAVSFEIKQTLLKCFLNN